MVTHLSIHYEMATFTNLFRMGMATCGYCHRCNHLFGKENLFIWVGIAIYLAIYLKRNCYQSTHLFERGWHVFGRGWPSIYPSMWEDGHLSTYLSKNGLPFIYLFIYEGISFIESLLWEGRLIYLGGNCHVFNQLFEKEWLPIYPFI